MKYLKIYDDYFDLKENVKIDPHYNIFISKLYKYLNSNINEVSIDGWKISIEMSGSYFWYKRGENYTIYSTPFWDGYMDIAVQVSSDEFVQDDPDYIYIPEWTTSYPLEKIPKTDKEIEEFFNWYINEFSPKLIKRVEITQKCYKFICLLIENKGQNGNFEYENYTFSLNSKLNVSIWNDEIKQLTRLKFVHLDFEEIEKIYNDLLKKYPAILVGSEWDFFGLK